MTQPGVARLEVINEPPHSIEAEQAYLGGTMLAGSICSGDEDPNPEDFYRGDHQTIARTLRALGGGSSADPVTVGEELGRLGLLQEAGGLAYLVTLVRDTPGVSNIRAYAQIIREKARLRRLLKIGIDVSTAIRDGATSAQIAGSLAPVLESFRSAADASALPAPLDWSTLEAQSPPERTWAIEHWLGLGHVTLLAGGGGTGKTSVAQAMASCLVHRHEFLDWMPAQRTVLMWAAEDEADELWRRQVAIAKWLNTPLSAFSERLHIVSLDGQQCELAALVGQQKLVATPMMRRLRDQIGDLGADVVVLDNVARLYAGNENDRHQVTSFVAMLTAASAPTKAAVLLLGHPAKQVGSEFSGSTAWEGAVRGRWYLGRTLPGAEGKETEFAEDDGVRYLCRRKANYGQRDWRRIRYVNGVMVPDIVESGARAARPGGHFARDVVTRAVRKLAEMGHYGVASSASANYLPKLAEQYSLLETVSAKEFGAAMRAMQLDRALIMKVVGAYPNRTKREGLALAEASPEVHK